MNTFHEINIFTSRGDFKSALVLLKNRTENVARKILKKAGYSVPDIYGRSFWLYVQNTIMQAARNRTCGYSIQTKSLSTPHEDNCIASLNVQEQTLSGSASTGNAHQELLSEKNISDSGCANRVATEIPQYIGINENDKLKLNKYTALAKIALLWTSFYILFLLPSVFLGSAWKRENILRQGYLLTSKVSATTLIAAAVVFLRPKPNDYVHHSVCMSESEQNHKRTD